MFETIWRVIRTKTIRDSLESFTGQFGAALMGAVFFALVFRLLGPQNFGLFSLGYATAIILKDLIDPAVVTSLLRFVPGASEVNTKAYRSYALRVILVYFSILTPLILLIGQYLSLILFQQLIFGMVPLILVTSLTLSLGNYLSGVMRSSKMFALEAVFTLSQPIIRLVLIGLLIVYQLNSVQMVLIVNVLAYWITVVFFWLWLKPELNLFGVSRHIKSQVNQFLSSMVITSMTGTVTERANLYITNFLLNLSSVGIFSAYAQLMRPVNQFVGAFDSVLGSRFAGFTTNDEARRYLFKAFGFSGLMIIGLLSSNLFMHLVIGLMYGQDLLEYYRVFQLFTLAYSVYILYGPINAYLLYYKGRADIMAMGALIQLALTLGFNWFFITRFGLIGAPLASLMVYSLMVIILGASAYGAEVRKKDGQNVSDEISS